MARLAGTTERSHRSRTTPTLRWTIRLPSMYPVVDSQLLMGHSAAPRRKSRSRSADYEYARSMLASITIETSPPRTTPKAGRDSQGIICQAESKLQDLFRRLGSHGARGTACDASPKCDGVEHGPVTCHRRHGTPTMHPWRQVDEQVPFRKPMLLLLALAEWPPKSKAPRGARSSSHRCAGFPTGFRGTCRVVLVISPLLHGRCRRGQLKRRQSRALLNGW